MEHFEANNGNVRICNGVTDTWLYMFYDNEQDRKCHVNIRLSLKDIVFIRNCFDTIIKQETIEGDMLQPMVENAVHNAMANMECKIIPK